MSLRQLEILEIFVEAQRLGTRRFHIGVIGNGGAHLFFRGEIAPQVAWRKKANREVKLARRRLPEPLPAPPERVEPCTCGAAWEHRTGSKQVIHVGMRKQGCARAA